MVGLAYQQTETHLASSGDLVRRRKLMAGWTIDDHASVDRQLVVDVHQLTRRYELPRRVLVYSFTGYHDGGPITEIRRANTNSTLLTDTVEMLVAMLTTRAPVEEVQLVRARVTQCPQLRRRHDNQVQRQHGHPIGEPTCGRRDPSRKIAAVSCCLLND
ncbi:MAG: hypothetical protein QOE07_610 [Acidimicrobiaceae bacterium]|nr:hypothetical protein [Acidimicrobiaceae bacterium]